MVCDDVKRVVYFYLDGVLGEKKHSDLTSHLKECPDCDDRVLIHTRLRNFFRRRLGRLTAPPALQVRLRDHRASSGESSGLV